jgi:hypothetical protein
MDEKTHLDLYSIFPDGDLVSVLPSEDVLDFIRSFPLGLRISVLFPRVVVLRMSLPEASLTSPLIGWSARAMAVSMDKATTSDRIIFNFQFPP